MKFDLDWWHDDLVDRTKLGFFERMAELGHGEDAIDVHKLPGGAAVETTTTAPASTTTTMDVGCADPPVCFYAVGENVCSVDGNAPCADDPRNIYVNETIGFSFAFDENWRRLGTDTNGRIQLVHEYFVPGDPFIVVSWEPTMGRTLDMFADELIASCCGNGVL